MYGENGREFSGSQMFYLREKGFVKEGEAGFCVVHDGGDGTDCTGPNVSGYECSALCCLITHGVLDCSFTLNSGAGMWQ